MWISFSSSNIYLLASGILFKKLYAVGTPNWDEYLADPLDIAPVSSPERDDNTNQQHLTQTMGRKERTLSQTPRAIKRRKERKELKETNPLLHKEGLKKKSEKRREKRIGQGLAVRDKTVMKKSQKVRYKDKIEFLQKPGNEEELKKHKDRILDENRRYMAKLRKEIIEGTASEKRLEVYERRLHTAKKRRISVQHHNV
jgi:hypothetical protein